MLDLELRPTVEVRKGELHATVEAAARAVAARTARLLVDGRRDGVVFSVGGRPSVLDVLAEYVGDKRRGTRLGARPVQKPALQAWLESQLRFVQPTGKGDVVVPAPERVVEWFRTEPWGAPELAGVSRVPLLRPDGSVVTTSGYDEPTGTWLDLDGDVEIPERPDLAAATAALCRVEAIVEQFPFRDAASRVHALALFLTAVGRSAIAGPVPMFVITANQPGSGKSLLSDLASILATGSPAPALSLVGDVELRKAITAHLATAPAVSKLDNVAGKVDSPALARLLTAVLWTDRVLGVSEMTVLPNQTTWILNGNNVVLGGDLRRRVVLIELATDRPEAWSRNGWKLPDLAGHVAAHRLSFVADCLTVLRAFCVLPVGERPEAPVHFGGGFEGWCALVGGALALVGEDAFLANAVRVEEHDLESAERGALLEALSRFATVDVPRTSRSLVDAALNSRGDPLTRRDLADALVNAIGPLEDVQAPKRLGEHLNRLVDAPLYVDGGDVAVLRRRHTRGKVATWWVERSEP